MFIGNDARTTMLMGINKVADFVAATMGPGGKAINIKLANNNHITKDGVTVAKHFVVADPAEQVGVDFIYEAANKTVTEAGDGTTTTTVMAREMMLQGHQRLALKKLNTNRVAKRMVHYSNIAIEHIKAQSRSVSLDTEEGQKLLLDVGTISANGDTQMAKMCLEAIKLVGPEPNSITYTRADFDEKDTFVFKSGMHIPSRVGGELLGPFNRRSIRGINDDGMVAVLIVPSTEMEVSLTNIFRGFMDQLSKKGHGILVVCKEPASNLKGYLVADSERFQTAFVSPNLHGNRYVQLCEDLTVLTGAVAIDDAQTRNDETPRILLGYCKSVDISPDGLTVIDPVRKGSPEHETLITKVQAMIPQETNAHAREQLKDRLARITNGVVAVRVTPTADSNVYERIDRYDDCVRAMITSLKTGVVRGGGVAYLSAAYQLLNEQVDPLDQEDKIARDLIEAALVTPFNTITMNAMNYIPKIDGKRLVNETTLTIDVWSGDFINAEENGILDPLGVQVTSIHSAVQATAVFLNTGGMYAGRNSLV